MKEAIDIQAGPLKYVFRLVIWSHSSAYHYFIWGQSLTDLCFLTQLIFKAVDIPLAYYLGDANTYSCLNSIDSLTNTWLVMTDFENYPRRSHRLMVVEQCDQKEEF